MLGSPVLKGELKKNALPKFYKAVVISLLRDIIFPRWIIRGFQYSEQLVAEKFISIKWKHKEGFKDEFAKVTTAGFTSKRWLEKGKMNEQNKLTTYQSNESTIENHVDESIYWRVLGLFCEVEGFAVWIAKYSQHNLVNWKDWSLQISL